MIRSWSFRHPRWLAAAALAITTSMISAPTNANSADAEQSSRSRPSGDSFILLKNDIESSMMSGSMADLREARRLRSGGEPLLYVRRGGSAYVIRDAALLREAEAITKPQAELGARQGSLGARQGALGAKQGELGRRQAALALRRVSGGRSQEGASEQERLGREMAELGRQQAMLGQEQARLGQEQARLGREAEAKLRALVDDALRRGLAQRIG